MDDYFRIDHKKKIIYFAIMLFFTAVMLISILRVTYVGDVSETDITIDDGWTVDINGKIYDNVTLSEFRFDMCNRGDVVKLTHVVPKYDSIKKPVLDLYSVHSTVKVLLDNEVIYQYGQKRYMAGKILGYGRHFVDFPENSQSKWLTIEYNVSENNAFDGVQPVKIADGDTIVVRDISGKRVNFAIALFLIVFGMIIMILSMLMVKKSIDFVATFCIAMFSFLTGCWTLCNADLIEYMTSDLLMKVYTEYISFYLLPLPFTYYFKDRIDGNKAPRWIKAFFWGLITLEIAFVICACTLQFLNIVHLSQMLSGAHILMLLAVLFIIILYVRDILQKKKNTSSIIVGFAIAVILVLFELLRFNLNKYFTGFAKNEYSSTTCFAVLIIVIAMMVDYGNKISTTLYENAHRMFLEQMAYMDELTGLGNRRACEEKLSKLEEKSSYAIISFDLNFLKKANDTYGHEKGDELIKSFADVLREVYGLYGVVTRTGGDEFVVIMDDISSKQIDKLISQMLSVMEELNKERTDIKLSAAYGYAMSNEQFSEQELMGRQQMLPDSVNPHIVYRIADDRMYEYKRKSKLGRN